MIKNSYELKPKSGNIEQIVILLHGVGSNGRDLISLAPYYQQALPQAVFISPDAPFPYDMAPPGFDAWQWFSLQERTYEKRLEGVQMVAPQVHLFIDEQLKKYNLPPSKLALVGFSQGTMTSLYVGPRYKEKIAGVLGYSGALIWEQDVPATLNKIPVHIVHGDIDDVVPVSAYHDAHKRLTDAGFPVTGEIERGLPHSINENGIENGANFLRKILT